MKIISHRKIVDYCKEHAGMTPALMRWCAIAEYAAWRNLAEMRLDFPETTCVDGYFVFDVLGDNKCLVVTKLVDDRLFVRYVGRRSAWNQN